METSRKLTCGTSHFKTKQHAVKYYAMYNENALDVDGKIKRGEIHIGRPKLKLGQTLMIDEDGRYLIMD